MKPRNIFVVALFAVATFIAQRLCRLGNWLHRLVPNKTKHRVIVCAMLLSVLAGCQIATHQRSIERTSPKTALVTEGRKVYRIRYADDTVRYAILDENGRLRFASLGPNGELITTRRTGNE